MSPLAGESESAHAKSAYGGTQLRCPRKFVALVELR